MFDATSTLWLQSVLTTASPAHINMLFISARTSLLLYQAAQHPAAVCKPHWYTVAQANISFYQLAGISHIPTCSRPAWLCCVGDALVEGIAGVGGYPRVLAICSAPSQPVGCQQYTTGNQHHHFGREVCLLSQGCSTYLQLVGTDLQFSNRIPTQIFVNSQV